MRMAGVTHSYARSPPFADCRVLDTAHVALSWHMTYYYLVLNYNNPDGLEELVWCATRTFVHRLSY